MRHLHRRPSSFLQVRLATLLLSSHDTCLRVRPPNLDSLILNSPLPNPLTPLYHSSSRLSSSMLTLPTTARYGFSTPTLIAFLSYPKMHLRMDTYRKTSMASLLPTHSHRLVSTTCFPLFNLSAQHPHLNLYSPHGVSGIYSAGLASPLVPMLP